MIGCTCLGVERNAELACMRFDCAVVDEAAQVAEPLILSALCLSTTAILVGDHFQLPPVSLANSPLADPLFRRLAESHPNAVARLNVQYRMNTDICSLCSSLTYSNMLRCGSDEVAMQRLVTPNLFALAAVCDCEHIIRCVQPEHSILFLCTAAFGAHGHDKKSHTSYTNASGQP